MIFRNIATLLILLRGIQGLAVPEKDSGAAKYEAVKRTTESGGEYVELDLNKFSDPDAKLSPSSLTKRQGIQDPIGELDDEDVKVAQEHFWFECGNAGDAIALVEEFYGAAQAILDKKGHYEVIGWTSPGVISISRSLNDAKKWADCTPVQCTSAGGFGRIELCGEGQFSHGVGISRFVIWHLLRVVVKICDPKEGGRIPPFEIKSKDKKMTGMVLKGTGAACADWTKDVCSKEDDESKAKCLALKGLYGVPWVMEPPPKPSGT
ncbi:hypothetical protein ABW19_dt0200462 [Dactylella cylindrospora]|nr:hypothetical protein ABW19_dt0200462 [Dactylella cylindrospora]